MDIKYSFRIVKIITNQHQLNSILTGYKIAIHCPPHNHPQKTHIHIASSLQPFNNTWPAITDLPLSPSPESQARGRFHQAIMDSGISRSPFKRPFLRTHGPNGYPKGCNKEYIGGGGSKTSDGGWQVWRGIGDLAKNAFLM